MVSTGWPEISLLAVFESSCCLRASLISLSAAFLALAESALVFLPLGFLGFSGFLSAFFSVFLAVFSSFFASFSAFLSCFSMSLLIRFASFYAVLSTDFLSFLDSVVIASSFASSVWAISAVSFLVFSFMIQFWGMGYGTDSTFEVKKSTNSYDFFRKNKIIALFLC